MKRFENVSVEQQANVYFDGKVTSRVVHLADGQRITLGFMVAGDYEFGTVEKERMEIVNGELNVRLPGETDWQFIKSGESFDVPANAKFQVKVTTFTDYTCYYLP